MHITTRRSIEDIRRTGAAWLTESELEWLCDEAKRAEQAEVALRNLEEVCPDCDGEGGDCEWCAGTGKLVKPAPEVAKIIHEALSAGDKPK